MGDHDTKYSPFRKPQAHSDIWRDMGYTEKYKHINVSRDPHARGTKTLPPLNLQIYSTLMLLQSMHQYAKRCL